MRPGGGCGDQLSCAELVEQLTEVLDGVQGGRERQRTLDHLRDCAGCQDYVDQYQLTVAGLARLPPPTDTLPAEVRSTVLGALRDLGGGDRILRR